MLPQIRLDQARQTHPAIWSPSPSYRLWRVQEMMRLKRTWCLLPYQSGLSTQWSQLSLHREVGSQVGYLTDFSCGEDSASASAESAAILLAQANPHCTSQPHSLVSGLILPFSVG